MAEEATKRRPDDGLAFFAFGSILHNQRHFVEAHHALRRAEQLLPDNPEVHRLLGLNYYLLKQYRLFEEQMLTAKALKPEAAEFDYWLGRYHQMVSGDYGKAISFFNRAISLDNSNYKALYNRGECHDENGDLASAEKDYLTAIKLIRERAVVESWPFQALAVLYLRTGQDDESLMLANEAVAMEANVAENHLVLGKVLSHRGDTLGAIRELEQAAILDPTDARVRYQLYRLHVKRRQSRGWKIGPRRLSGIGRDLSGGSRKHVSAYCPQLTVMRAMFFWAASAFFVTSSGPRAAAR